MIQTYLDASVLFRENEEYRERVIQIIDDIGMIKGRQLATLCHINASVVCGRSLDTLYLPVRDTLKEQLQHTYRMYGVYPNNERQKAKAERRKRRCNELATEG